MPRRLAGWLALVLVAAVAPAARADLTAGPTVDLAVGSGAAPASARSGAPAALSPTEARYLTTRPAVGPVRIADLAGEPPSRRLLAATLEGVVNRTQARLYLTDGGAGTWWIDQYQQQGLVSVTASGGLDGALDAFAAEAGGYVVASESEPWTIDAATTVAAATNGVVALEDQVAGLQARGLNEIDDLRGRWPDAPTAYESIVATYRSQLPFTGVAILHPDQHALRDFLVQQGILVIDGRVSFPYWDRIVALVDSYPAGFPVYGYLSDDGVQEIQTVGWLSGTGKFLVPTDSTANLSFHVAVRPKSDPTYHPPPASGTPACTTNDVNVVVAISDGDNFYIPTTWYAEPDEWRSPKRGSLPMGWSVAPGLAVLAPAMWGTYTATATPNDELVGMMGLGYAYAGREPDPVGFYGASFKLARELGFATMWSLDIVLSDPTASLWSALETAKAGAGGTPAGMLVGYVTFTGGDYVRGPAGTIGLLSRTSYLDTPGDLVNRVRAVQALPPAGRPLVTFLSAANWTNPAGPLYDALAPLEQEGVRFLTPSQAVACIEAASKPPPTTTPPPTSSASSTSTQPEPAGAVGASPLFTG